jgi:L-threonylcarbamoyladenylate synthase
MERILMATCDILNIGGTILYPTDTIWGVGCDATNYDAVKKIYSIKKREESKSMLILVNSIEMIKKYVEAIPEIALSLIHASTHPLTIIYPKGKNLAKNLLAEDGSIGIRIVKNEFCNQLLDLYNKPIVSTSANIAGDKSPLGFFDISEKVKSVVDYIVPLNHDKLSPTRSSDIIKVTLSGKIEIIR